MSFLWRDLRPESSVTWAGRDTSGQTTPAFPLKHGLPGTVGTGWKGWDVVGWQGVCRGGDRRGTFETARTPTCRGSPTCRSAREQSLSQITLEPWPGRECPSSSVLPWHNKWLGPCMSKTVGGKSPFLCAWTVVSLWFSFGYRILGGSLQRWLMPWGFGHLTVPWLFQRSDL